MRLSTWLPLGLAVVLGLAAAIVARGYMAKGNNTKQVNTNHVITAAKNIAPGKALTAADLTMGPVGGDEMPEGAFHDASELIDRVITTPVVKGQIISEGFLAPKGAIAGIQHLVPTGMRWTTIEVNEFSALAGMLAPGCRVDIVSAMSDPESREMMARTIVENAKVVAVGQRVSPTKETAEGEEPSQDPGFRSVTLEVSPQEAEAIHVAGTGGRPWMVLRGSTDNKIIESEGVEMATLRTGNVQRGALRSATEANLAKIAATPEMKPAGKAKSQRTVTFIKGGKMETIMVDDAEPKKTPAAKKTDDIVTNLTEPRDPK